MGLVDLVIQSAFTGFGTALGLMAYDQLVQPHVGNDSTLKKVRSWFYLDRSSNADNDKLLLNKKQGE